MQSENFDNKMKEAADRHHPNYDEKAWAKMEKLLDLHLPQRRDSKRFIFFLLFFLLSGGGAWLIISKPWQQIDQPPGVEKTIHQNEATESSTATNSSADKKRDEKAITEPATENPVANVKKDIVTAEDAGSTGQKRNQDIIVSGGKANTYQKGKALPGKNNNPDQLVIEIANPGNSKKDKNPPEINSLVSSPGNSNYKVLKNNNPAIRTDQQAGNIVTQDKTIETKNDNVPGQPKTTDKKDIARKSSGKKSNSFFFSFSAGPDISSVGIDKPGKVKFPAGAGLGYTFNNRWTVRTGFYTGRKVYSTNKEEYNPSVPPFNYGYLDKIDADCQVYEIPVSLAYNFNRSEKHNLFAAAGLSSYIMKKETYNYIYKYPGGAPPTVRTWTLRNENKHYFSVLTLSGGYQRKINKTFSIAAEPYIKLPLKGIGFGKVKLNSAGILFSINISPFQAAAKK